MRPPPPASFEYYDVEGRGVVVDNEAEKAWVYNRGTGWCSTPIFVWKAPMKGISHDARSFAAEFPYADLSLLPMAAEEERAATALLWLYRDGQHAPETLAEWIKKKEAQGDWAEVRTLRSAAAVLATLLSESLSDPDDEQASGFRLTSIKAPGRAT